MTASRRALPAPPPLTLGPGPSLSGLRFSPRHRQGPHPRAPLRRCGRRPRRNPPKDPSVLTIAPSRPRRRTSPPPTPPAPRPGPQRRRVRPRSSSRLVHRCDPEAGRRPRTCSNIAIEGSAPSGGRSRARRPWSSARSRMASAPLSPSSPTAGARLPRLASEMEGARGEARVLLSEEVAWGRFSTRPRADDGTNRSYGRARVPATRCRPSASSSSARSPRATSRRFAKHVEELRQPRTRTASTRLAPPRRPKRRRDALQKPLRARRTPADPALPRVLGHPRGARSAT